jgi:hypothetical protein
MTTQQRPVNHRDTSLYDKHEYDQRRSAALDYQRFLWLRATEGEIRAFLVKKQLIPGEDLSHCTKTDLAMHYVLRRRGFTNEVFQVLMTKFGLRAS